MKIIEPGALGGIEGLVRCEEFDREALGERITEMTHTVYPHDQVYGAVLHDPRAHRMSTGEGVFVHGEPVQPHRVDV